MCTNTGKTFIFLNAKTPKIYFHNNIFGLLKYQINILYYGYPVILNGRFLAIGLNELFDEISQYFNNEVKKVK